ncbi:MAG: cbb3-type cytochrome oxidase assembly protein CcoS [Epsilonproteobacteria bacterium]|nr:MAG: cbb3-type cytochrome oxidase assembly protein CcoS [Campylobacterota bacterium]RLA65350.1 MAG: cbb3-type cytochrome oxidase assembly protein CcoS [Campylobacterota bacterium]
MNVIYILLPLSLLLGITFLVIFIWSVKKGQYDDLSTPAHRMLFDEEYENKKRKNL